MGDKEKILEQLEAARLKVQQYENKIQLLQNRQKHLEKKADKQRTHHLCNMGGGNPKHLQRSGYADKDRILFSDGTGICLA